MYIEDGLRVGELAGLDPSFRSVPRDLLKVAQEKLASAPSGEVFFLEAMRLMALGRNGHSRAIPNPIARVAPIRFVWLADGPCVVEGHHYGARLVAVNGVDVATIFKRSRPLLSGSDQRARALAPFIFAWQPAITRATGAAIASSFRLETPAGDTVDLEHGHSVPAVDLYPIRERGVAGDMIAAAGLAELPEARTGIFHRLLGGRTAYVRIGDLAAASRDSISAQLDAILDDFGGIRQLIIDLRGNPGGSFFGALGFTRRIPDVAPHTSVEVLVDKFTFSAALVTAALLKVHAGARIIGEEMGDTAQFFAEGGTEALPYSGLHIRYSDGWHDWCHGQADRLLTPPEIAREMVAAGSLLPDIWVKVAARDLLEGRDPALERALALQYL